MRLKARRVKSGKCRGRVELVPPMFREFDYFVEAMDFLFGARDGGC
jgi:hypothetical protein